MIFQKERRKVLAHLARWFAVLGTALFWPITGAPAMANKKNQEAAMKLPAPKMDGSVSLEWAIKQRRTVRSFQPQTLNRHLVSQLLWAAQGITEDSGFKRATPSAGALYPMDVYAVIGKDCVKKMDAGVYHYDSRGHQLAQVAKQDLRGGVAAAALSQTWIAQAPLSFVITAEYSRIAVKYGRRGFRYAMIEAGHIGQNLFLQAEALGLKAGIVGAFQDKELNEILKIPHAHEPLLIMPVGYAG